MLSFNHPSIALLHYQVKLRLELGVQVVLFVVNITFPLQRNQFQIRLTGF